MTGYQEYAPIRRSKLTQLNSTAIVWSEIDDDDPKDPKPKNRGIVGFISALLKYPRDANFESILIS